MRKLGIRAKKELMVTVKAIGKYEMHENAAGEESEKMSFTLTPEQMELAGLHDLSDEKMRSAAYEKVKRVGQEILIVYIYNLVLQCVAAGIAMVYPPAAFIVALLLIGQHNGMKIFPVTDKNVDGKMIMRMAYKHTLVGSVIGGLGSWLTVDVDFNFTKIKDIVTDLLKKYNLIKEEHSELADTLDESAEKIKESLDDVEKKVKHAHGSSSHANDHVIEIEPIDVSSLEKGEKDLIKEEMKEVVDDVDHNSYWKALTHHSKNAASATANAPYNAYRYLFSFGQKKHRYLKTRH